MSAEQLVRAECVRRPSMSASGNEIVSAFRRVGDRSDPIEAMNAIAGRCEGVYMHWVSHGVHVPGFKLTKPTETEKREHARLMFILREKQTNRVR